ncbi:ATP-binding cassette domain-containing protein [Aerosakkonemataceae cyanobacterium BLCC-F154]|uniref:ATP-binding cassette domain-containing protein n=1 Tax=Floridaenema fluviatile BLCC-F154 TaxID=3153640 RepID=A0ABV4YGH2_9CYAN
MVNNPSDSLSDVPLNEPQTNIEDILKQVEDRPPEIVLNEPQSNIEDILKQVEDAPQRQQSSNNILLSANGLNKSFGGLKAVDNATLEVSQGSITGLIGPNGAGKTTLFNLISNFIRPDSGRVIFDGEPVERLQSYQIAQMGMIRTFQVARVLSRLSVMENMLLAAQKQIGENFWNVWLRAHELKREEKELRERAIAVLESVGLADKANDYAGSLSGGQRKLLEMGRALMSQPKLILLDEPAAGVNPTLINQICDRILSWNRQGMTFLIIEHNMDVIMSLCDRVWVLAEGRNLAVGTPEEIQNNSEVLEAYLGQ